MAVGDVNSSERGTGARFNDGKVRLDYVPARVLADYYRGCEPEQILRLLDDIADFEEGADISLTGALFEAIGGEQTEGVSRWRAVADVFDYGARKYAAWNWAKGMAWSIPLACIKRHAVEIIEGEELDPESKLLHRGHIGCNIVMLMHYVRNFPEGDDRPPVQCFAPRIIIFPETGDSIEV